MRFVVITVAALLLPGCIAKAAWDVATLPVKAGSQAVDWTTTSQEESDRNYGRKMRKQEAREGKERRAYEKACRKDPQHCEPYEGYRAGDPER
jgi:hypothetical protein